MTVTVRPMGADEDLAPLNADNPLGWVADWVRHMPEDPAVPTHWWVGELDGVPAGFANVGLAPLAAGGYARALIYVLGPSRRAGVGQALRTTIEDAVRGAGLPGVLAAYDEDDTEAAAAVAAWGLAVSQTHHESVLDLERLDAAALDAHVTRAGIEIRPLPDPASMDEITWRGLHAFLQDRSREAPDSADGGGMVPFEMFRSMVAEPWSLVTAHDPDAASGAPPLGLTLVMQRPGMPDARNTFFTGVAEPARGRGVALALKARQALLMAEAGVTALYTQNLEGNEPILAANRRLGFVRSSGYCDVAVAV